MISARIELQRSWPPAGSVVIVNPDGEPVRIWRPGNQWGDEALSFELHHGALHDKAVRTGQIYTRNVPAPATIPAGDSYRLPFDLDDGTWSTGRDLDQMTGSGATLAAIYQIPPSSEATAHGVWTGRVQSPPVSLNGTEGGRP